MTLFGDRWLNRIKGKDSGFTAHLFPVQRHAHQREEVSRATAQQTTWEMKLGFGANTCKFS